jgi:hypothetical protein
MLDHIPYCCSVVARVNIKVKARPVAMLSILAINRAKPEYCSLISLFVKVFHLYVV